MSKSLSTGDCGNDEDRQDEECEIRYSEYLNISDVSFLLLLVALCVMFSQDDLEMDWIAIDMIAKVHSQRFSFVKYSFYEQTGLDIVPYCSDEIISDAKDEVDSEVEKFSVDVPDAEEDLVADVLAEYSSIETCDDMDEEEFQRCMQRYRPASGEYQEDHSEQIEEQSCNVATDTSHRESHTIANAPTIIAPISSMDDRVEVCQQQKKSVKELLPKISFLDFQSGDIALFLPMDAQIRSVWSAFNSMKQHFYLSEVSIFFQHMR